MPPYNKPLERRLKNDEEDALQEDKRSDSGEPEDAIEQSTLVLNAKDAGELFEFSGNDNKKFRKLFALIADLYLGKASKASHNSCQPRVRLSSLSSLKQSFAF